MIIKLEDRSEIECLVAVLSLGLCTALENKYLTIQEAEDYLFSPYTMRVLRQAETSAEVVGLIHLGTELENVQRIIPEQLQNSLNDMKSLSLSILQSQPESLEPKPKWLQGSGEERP